MTGRDAAKPEEFFSAAVLNSPDIISISRLDDGGYLQVNDSFLSITGFSRDEVIGKTSNDLELWAEEDGRERFRALLARERRVRDLDVRFRLRSGEIRNFQMSAAIVRIGDRECVTAACRDSTDRNEMIDRLEKDRFLLERAEEMADIGSWELDYLTGEVAVSPGACKIYGIAEADFTVKAIEKVPLPEYRGALDRARDSLIKEGLPYDIEFRIARKNDGAIRTIRSKARWDPAHKTLFGMIRDVTEEKESAASLKLALAEKETLIKELYHRTKNNMQVITSLLGIQSARSGEGRVRQVFEEMQRRIESMALVHEMLYRSQDLTRIDLRRFIPSLANLIESSLGDGDGRIAVACEVGEVELLIDTAVPCSIIINELVTNALIHAFPGKRTGTVTIAARREADGTVLISVEDDGVGSELPTPGEEWGKSLGLPLVSSIGRSQLGGSVDFTTGKGGFGCTLRFRDTLYKARV